MHNKKRSFKNTSEEHNNDKTNIKELKAKFLDGLGNPENEPFVVDSFQQEAIDSVLAGHDTLVVAPTGSGKTFIALEGIRSAVELGRRAIYTTPLKALSNTKYTELKKKFAPNHTVGLLTGDRKIDTDSDIVIATTEIYRNELYRNDGIAKSGNYHVVVLDEVHFISDEYRGPVWEESIILTPKSSTLLMLSASISNYESIAEWISEVRGKPCKVVIKTGRPVELRWGFLHPTVGAIPLANDSGLVAKEVSGYYAGLKGEDSDRRFRGGRDGGNDRQWNNNRPDDRRFSNRQADKQPMRQISRKPR